MHGSLIVQLEYPRLVNTKQSVPLTLSIKNIGDSMIEVFLGGGPPHDFELKTIFGNEIWKLSYGSIRTDVLQQKTLQPDEVFKLEGKWSQLNNSGKRVLPGIYLIHGTVNIGDPSQQIKVGPRLLLIRP